MENSNKYACECEKCGKGFISKNADNLCTECENKSKKRNLPREISANKNGVLRNEREIKAIKAELQELIEVLNDIADMLLTLGDRSKKTITSPCECPNCGSELIKIQNKLNPFLVGDNYKCKKCGRKWANCTGPS